MTRKLWIPFFVLLTLLLVGGAGFLFLHMWPLLTQTEPLPTITVEALYPGANAQVVADTVAAPIEQQVNGVEDMVSLRSQSTSDGRYTLTVSFKRSADLNIALVLVQNRVNLALPILPDLVKQRGVTVQKKSPRAVLFVVLSSPDGRYDALYLSRYASLYVKDELARLGGVANVVVAGQQEDKFRIWLDRQKLVDIKLTVADVTSALKQQNLEVEPGKASQEVQLTLGTHGRMTDPEELAQAIMRVDGMGRIIRLKDVAQIELGSNTAGSQAWLNGKPVVALAVYPLPGAKASDVLQNVQDKLALLRKYLPDGLDLQVACELAPQWPAGSEYLRVDLALPDSASAERTRNVAQMCATLVRNAPGVDYDLLLCGPPFVPAENQALVLVRLANDRKPRRQELMQTLRSRLEEQLPETAVRICDVSNSTRFPLGGYEINLAVVDTADSAQTGQLAEKLVERLRQSGKLTDVALGGGAAVPHLELTIDRTRAKAVGVAINDIFDTLQVYLGSFYVNDFNRFGRTWQVRVSDGGKARSDDIMKLKVRNANGEMVSLGSLLSVRRVEGPVVIERIDMYPGIGITANPAAGVSVKEARTLCESLAEEVRKELGLPAQFRLVWVQE
jgi:multidrug efflux pump subunit AcrB